MDGWMDMISRWIDQKVIQKIERWMDRWIEIVTSNLNWNSYSKKWIDEMMEIVI